MTTNEPSPPEMVEVKQVDRDAAAVFKPYCGDMAKEAMVTLQFVNSDAKPKTVAVRCDTASIAPVMAWYGAYFAGDRYAVYADGEKLPKDRNGELEGDCR